MNAKPTPVIEKQRIDSLDTLRGVAVFGILAMNITAFSIPAAAYFNPGVYGDLSGINLLLWQVAHLLAEYKFMAIFSMLFGAGIVLMSERCEARDQKPAGLHYRRMLWLIFFGLLHAHLLWYGDILFSYGICGLVVYLFRKFSPKWLIIIGLLSISLTSGIMFAAGSFVPNMPPESLAEIKLQLDPPPELIAEEIKAYQGGWLDQMTKRVPKAFELQTTGFLMWSAWRIGGLMLLGMALFKLGVFSARRSRKLYLTLIALAIAIGIPATYYGMQVNLAAGFQVPEFFFFGLQFNYWASLLVSLGWVSVVMLICQTEKLAWLTRPFSAVGRTAFSNYILQTVICITIFYGHGFGLFGQVDRTGQAAILVAVWILQLILSTLWLRYFVYGPLEWLWRTLSYMKRQPFRRVAAESNG